MEYSDDILLWPDGFWCYRAELSPTFLRDDGYRVIASSALEWFAYREKRVQEKPVPSLP